MGRHRTLTREELFAAVEKVVQDHGPLGLTIEAVARAAGVSKATVLYEYPSKADLVMAFMSAKIDTHRTEVDAAAAASSHPAKTWFEGLVGAIGNCGNYEDSLAPMLMGEALKADNPCRAMLRGMMEEDVLRLQGCTSDPRSALLAYLATHGLAMLTLYGSASFSPVEHQRILEDIIRLAFPEGGTPAGPCMPPETST